MEWNRRMDWNKDLLPEYASTSLLQKRINNLTTAAVLYMWYVYNQWYPKYSLMVHQRENSAKNLLN